MNGYEHSEMIGKRMLKIKKIKQRYLYFLILQIFLGAAFIYAQESFSIKDFDGERDAGAITSMITASWTELFWQPYDTTIIDSMLIKKRSVDAQHKNKEVTIKVLQVNKHVAGFVSYLQTNPGICHIELLAVAKEYQGKGYGRKLVDYVCAEAKAKNLQLVELCVYERNKPACDFYAHLNFTVHKRFVMPPGLPTYLVLHKKIT
jgi:ribosomal protein S18 acetylase RimI-like enzyme